jgi:hypothetical protein
LELYDISGVDFLEKICYTIGIEKLSKKGKKMKFVGKQKEFIEQQKDTLDIEFKCLTNALQNALNNDRINPEPFNSLIKDIKKALNKIIIVANK